MEPNIDSLRISPNQTPAKTKATDPMVVDLEDLDRITEDSLGFSALTDGLGFHPRQRKVGTLRPSNTFDEFPLAPPPETDDLIAALMGTQKKAAAAAPPEMVSFARPPSDDPTFLVTKNNFEPAPVYKAAFADEKIAVSETEPPASSTAAHKSLKFASPVERGKALALDLAFIYLPLWATLVWNLGDQPGFLSHHWKSSTLFISVIFAFYLLLSESLGGQSLGKMLMGLVVVEDDKYRKPIGFASAGKRLIFFFLGLIPVGLGSFVAFWDSNSRTLHDRLSASTVERRLEE